MNENSVNLELMPREKLLKFGVESLSDEELVAIFLRTGIKNCPVMELSRQVLQKFGSLRNLITADMETFCKIRGLGVTQYVQLQAVTEITKRYLKQEMEITRQFNSTSSTKIYLQTVLEQREREIFLVLFLDNQHRLLKSEEMFLGTINSASVHPREIIKSALFCNAAALILAHNHPSGISEPSLSDRQITNDIKQVSELMGIRVLDHVIIGKGNYFSFAESGWL